MPHAAAAREFMLRQTCEADSPLRRDGASAASLDPADLPMRVVIPAHAISELKTGFQMGFFLHSVPAHRPHRVDDAAVDGHAVALLPAMIRCRSRFCSFRDKNDG